jgi:AraC-like DNA-binding protein
MENLLAELRSFTARAEARGTETGIPRVSMVRGDVPAHDLATAYQPMINLIVQGRKLMTIGGRVLHFDPATYFVMSMDLPAVGTVHPGPAGEPYMATSLTLDPARIAALLADLPGDVGLAGGPSFAVAAVTPELLDAWVRMLRLMDRPDDIAALAPVYEREILYRVLSGPHAALLRGIATPGAALERIDRAVRWIRQNLTARLCIEELAARAVMSPSSFYRHFKQATALSPVQFQKELRLLQARLLLISGGMNVTDAAFEVGYGSVTQFTREYARHFGLPPAQDTKRILRHGAQDGL